MRENWKLFELMNVPFAGMFIWKVNLLNWGQKVSIECSYEDLSDEKKMFSIVLNDCSKIYWEMTNDQVDERDVNADVVGVQLKNDVHPHSIIITTDIFEIGATFEGLEIIKDW